MSVVENAPAKSIAIRERQERAAFVEDSSGFEKLCYLPNLREVERFLGVNIRDCLARFIACQGAYFWLFQPWAVKATWTALKFVGAFALMCYALATGKNDPADFQMDDGSTQRKVDRSAHARTQKFVPLVTGSMLKSADCSFHQRHAFRNQFGAST